MQRFAACLTFASPVAGWCSRSEDPTSDKAEKDWMEWVEEEGGGGRRACESPVGGARCNQGRMGREAGVEQQDTHTLTRVFESFLSDVVVGPPLSSAAIIPNLFFPRQPSFFGISVVPSHSLPDAMHAPCTTQPTTLAACDAHSSLSSKWVY